MNLAAHTYEQLTDEVADLRARLNDANETLRAIRTGEVDAVLVQGSQGDQLFTLKGADEPYRVLIEEMNQGAVTLSVDGSILYCNRRFADLLRTPVEEIVGVDFGAFVAPSERSRFTALLEMGRISGSAGEITLYSTAASAVPLQLALGPLPAGSAAAICLIATDISESRQAKEALKKSEQHFRALADAMPQIVWTARSDGLIDYYNQRWFDYTGMTYDQTLGWAREPSL
jgi:two-component system, OmpR family, phosphate regulon sensor histidine kinase PhoR